MSSSQEGQVAMQDEIGVFEDFLRKQRLKHSKPRRDIVDVLLASDGHLTAHELYHEVKERNASIGFATVYRTLRLLAECGRRVPWIMGMGPYGTSQSLPASPYHLHRL